jgi:hypothetical protein
MLLGQQRGRRQHGDLLAAQHRHERRAQRTSVLPKPTSPQTRRSIGLPDVMSAITAAMAAAWSGVSSKPKLSANAS